MDTTTVLEIIEMLTIRKQNYAIDTIAVPATTETQACFSLGRMRAYTEIIDHLQEYIESQLNAHEMNTEEG